MHKILKILIKNILQYINVTVPRKVNGTRYKIPIIKFLGIANISMNEYWMISALKIFDLKEGSFLDIGANVGQSLIKIKSVYKDIEYFGFEPNPINCFYLKQLIKINRMTNVQIIPVAISAQDGLTELYFYGKSDTDGSASIIADYRSNPVMKSEFIPTLSGRTIFRQIKLNKVSGIKIDVEGAELEVLNGLSDLIKANRPIIFIEVLPIYTIENKVRMERQLKIEELIRAWDFSIFRVIKEGKRFKELEHIKEIGIHSDIKKSDYIFVPNERKL
jgi:FkbM family methyltransferase